MDNSSLVCFVVITCIFGIVTAGAAHDNGPRATLALGLGEVVLATLLGTIASTTATPVIGAAALGVVVVAVLAIFAVGVNKWLPK